MKRIFLLLLILGFIGCTNFETTIEDVKSKIFSPKYRVEIEEVKIIDDCLQNMRFTATGKDYDPCLFVNIRITNNDKESIHFLVKRHAIVTKDGKQYGKYTGLFGLGAGLYKPCDESLDLFGQGFVVFPKGYKDVALCFPVVRKEDDPILYIGLYNEKEQKTTEFSFNLAEYL